MTPTARSLKLLREEGWLPGLVEQTIRIPGGRTFKRDLWGFIDIIAIRDAEVLAVQTTSGSNMASRIKKITDSVNLWPVRQAGIKIEVHGWVRRKAGWECRREDLS